MNKFYLLAAFFIAYNTCVSQEVKLDSLSALLPKSIYTKNIATEINSSFQIQNKLNLTNFNFFYLDVQKIDDGYFTIPLKDIGKQSDFVFETYKDIQNKRNLEQSFFDINKLYLPHIPK